MQILYCLLSGAASDGCFLGGSSTQATIASGVGFSRHIQAVCDALIPCVPRFSLAGAQHTVKLVRDS